MSRRNLYEMTRRNGPEEPGRTPARTPTETVSRGRDLSKMNRRDGDAPINGRGGADAHSPAVKGNPSVGERIVSALKGTGANRVAGHLGTAENLLGLGRELDIRADTKNRADAEMYERNAKHYKWMLDHNQTPDGQYLSPQQRDQFYKMMKQAEKNAGISRDVLKPENRQLTDPINKVDAAGDRMQEIAEQNHARGKQGLGTIGSLAYDVGTGAVDVLADMGENILLPGLGTAGRFSRTYGNTVEAAQDAGATVGQQALTGGLTAGVGEGINRLFGGNPILEKATGRAGALDDILFPNLGKTLPGRMVKSGIGEAIEEGVENPVDYAIRRGVYDHEGKEKFSWQDMGRDALVGGLIGGLTGISAKKDANPTARATETAQESVKPTAPNVDAPKTESAPAASEGARVDVAENATTTKTRNQQAAEFAKQAEQRVQNAVESGAPQAQVEALKAIAEDARNRVGFDTAEDRATVSKNATVAEESSDVGQNPSMGAADKGFDGGYAEFQAQADQFHPINESTAERTAEERGRAPTEVPTHNPNTGEYIGKSISTMLNAPITSNEAAEALEGALVDGKFTHVTIPDSTLKNNAQAKVNADTYKTVASNFIAMVDGGKRISAQDSVDALMAFNEAVNQNDQATIVELTEAMDNVKNDTARLFRSFGFVNRLTPAGNLLRLSQVVKRINGKAGSKLAEQMEISKALQEAVDQAKQQRAEVVEILQTMIDEYAEQYGQKPKTLEDILAGKSTASEIDAKIAEGKSSWIAELAKALAQNAASTVRPRTDRERTVYELISSDLNKFMHQYLSRKKQTTKKRTAGDTLRDFFANRQEYARAWNMAKDNLRQQYKDNPDMLGRLEEFLGGTITYNSTGSDAVMMRAMVDAALSQDVRAKEKLIRGKYDASNLAAEIASDVIRESGATDPSDIDLIEQAAKRWVDAETTKAADARRDATANSSSPAGVGEEAQSYFRGDIRKAMHDIGLKMQEIILQNAGSKESAGRQIAELLSNRYRISPDGATRIASDIMANYDAMVNEAAEAKLEAMFKDRGSRVKKSVQQKFTELANLGAFTNDQYNTQAAQKIFGYDGIKVDAKDAEAYLNAKTEEDRETAWNNLLDKVAEQLPTSGVEKWNAWRYTSMLGNLRTHGRNILGNTGVQPMRVIKDRLAAGMEAGVNKIAETDWGKKHNVGKIERTKAFVYDPKLWKFAWADSNDKTSQDLMAGGKIDDIPGELDQRKRIFRFGPFELARERASASLEREDQLFKRITYTDALSGYLSARGITAKMANNGQIPPELMQKARAYAANEARVATFQDENAFSDMVSAIGSEIDRVGGDRVWAKVVRGGAKLMVEGNLPFKRTPGNVFVTGMRYSPLGYVDALVKAYEAKTGRGATANDVIDSIATATTGSGMFALGAMLFAKGVLSASHDDDDEKAFDDLQGKQEYALTVNGKTYTMDWAAPEAIPLFMGAEFAQTCAEEGFGVKAILNAIKASSGPMLEMSMLSSLNDAIENVKWAEGNPLPALVAQTAVSYLMQGIPTMLGQFERSTQEDSMMTYVDPGSPLPRDLQKILGKASARIPGWDYNQIPYIDGWGRTEKTEKAGDRLFANLLSPSFVADIEETPVDKEIQRIYDSTGKLLSPGRYDKTINLGGGKEKDLSAEEYVKYAQKVGQTRYKTVESMIKTPAYKKLSDEQKAKAIQEAYEYATAVGKMAVSSYKPSGFAKGATETKLPVYAYITYKATADTSGNGDIDGVECANALKNVPGVTDAQRGAEWARANSTTKPEKNPFTGALPKAGVSVEKSMGIYRKYSELNKNKTMKVKEKGAAFGSYVRSLGLNPAQLAAVKSTYAFFGSYPVKW